MSYKSDKYLMHLSAHTHTHAHTRTQTWQNAIAKHMEPCVSAAQNKVLQYVSGTFASQCFWQKNEKQKLLILPSCILKQVLMSDEDKW